MLGPCAPLSSRRTGPAASQQGFLKDPKILGATLARKLIALRAVCFWQSHFLFWGSPPVAAIPRRRCAALRRWAASRRLRRTKGGTAGVGCAA